MGWNKNHNLAIHIIILLLLQTVNLCLYAQADTATGANPVWNNQQWEKAKQGVDYRDEREKEEEDKKPKKEETPSEINDNSNDFELSDFFLSPFGKLLCILLIIVLLAATIAFLLSNRGSVRDKKINLPQLASMDEMEELPEETDLEQFLRLALESGDYKVAVRILYIGIIQRLHEVKFIVWKKDKTNRDYLNEMRSRKSFHHFRDLTIAYELVWYGDTDIDRAKFEQLQSVFFSYKNNLNDSEEK